MRAEDVKDSRKNKEDGSGAAGNVMIIIILSINLLQGQKHEKSSNK